MKNWMGNAVFVSPVTAAGLAAAASVAGCAPEVVNEETAAASCMRQIVALGISAPEVEPVVKREDDGRLLLMFGEVACIVHPPATVVAIRDMAHDATSSEASGGPMIQSEEEALDYAKVLLQNSSIQLSDPIEIRPPGPWTEHQRLIGLSSEPLAFGYRTAGFAGRTSLTLDRFTRRVVDLSTRGGLTPDPPNVKVTEEQAIETADARFALAGTKLGPNEQLGRTARLQYYSSRSGATVEGRQYRQAGRLRLCWVILYSRDTATGVTRGYITSVAIDSETGKVLSNP
jgi:hypothetical protein